MLNLTVRNLKIYFRQKSAVFFSMLGVFIIIGLYALFLGDVWVRSYNFPGADILMSNWIIAGIVAVTSITTTMGAFGTMVEDRVTKNNKDLFASPVKRHKIVGGYILSAYIIGIIMSLLAFVVGEIYIVASGGEFLSFLSLIKMLGVILISVLASSSIVFFIVSFFYSTTAFSTASTILGTLIGFLTGIYIPIGVLPDTIQMIIKLFPVSHAGALMRQIMMTSSFEKLAIPPNYLSELKQMTGVIYMYGNHEATPAIHILVLLGTSLIFFLLSILNVSKAYK